MGHCQEVKEILEELLAIALGFRTWSLGLRVYGLKV
jgi:hypothetical protein